MVEIVRSGECRNSPKNAAMEAIAIAIFYDPDDCLRSFIADDASLHLPDGRIINDENAAYLHIVQHMRHDFDVVTIDHAITHGRVGAANGTLEIQGRVVGFCVIVDFANSKTEQFKVIKMYGLDKAVKGMTT